MSLSRSLHQIANDHGCNDEHPLRKAALLVQHIADAQLRQILGILFHHLVDQSKPDVGAITRFVEASGLRLNTLRDDGYHAIAIGVASSGCTGAAMATVMELSSAWEVQQNLRRAFEQVGIGDDIDD